MVAGSTTVATISAAATEPCRTNRERWQTLDKQDMTSVLLKDQGGERVPSSCTGRKAVRGRKRY
jgi:hypothetical protein